MGREHVRVGDVGVAPPQLGVQCPSLHHVVGVMGVSDGELPQRNKVRLDRVGSGGVDWGEAHLNLVPACPGTNPRFLVGGQVVQDHVDVSTAEAVGAVRALRCGSGDPWGPAVRRIPGAELVEGEEGKRVVACSMRSGLASASEHRNTGRVCLRGFGGVGAL